MRIANQLNNEFLEIENNIFNEQNKNDISSPNVQVIMALQKENKTFIEILVSVLEKEFEALVFSMKKPISLINSEENSERELDDYERISVNLRHFKPEAEILFDAFESCGKVATQAGYTEKTLGTLISQIVNAELHLYGIPNPAISCFEEQELAITKMLQSCTQEERDQFWTCRNSCIHLYREKEALEYELSEIVLEVSIADTQRLKKFGDLLIQKKDLSYKLDELSLKIDLKIENPDLSWEALEIKAIQILSIQNKKEDVKNNQRRYNESLKNGLSLAATQESDAEIETKRRIAVHKLTLNIKSLIHNDRIIFHPNYHKLSDNDKKFLEDLIRVLPSGKGKNLDSAQLFHGYDLHSPTDLQLMVYRAQAILDHAGIENIKKDTLIPGESMKKKIEFLDLEILRLRKMIVFLKAQFSAHNEYIRRAESALMNPETERKSLTNQIRVYQENIIAFEKTLQELFEPGADSKDDH